MTRQEELKPHGHDHGHHQHTPHDDPAHPHRHHGPTHRMTTYYPPWFIVTGIVLICLVVLVWFLAAVAMPTPEAAP